MIDDPIYVTKEVPEKYPIFKKGWLEKKRTTGGGPPFIRIGTKVGYRRSDIEKWLDENRRTSTSDPGPASQKHKGGDDGGIASDREPAGAIAHGVRA